MSSFASGTEQRAIDDGWHEIERLIEEVADLARSDCPPSSFREQLLLRLLRILGAPLAAIWVSHGGDWRRIHDTTDGAGIAELFQRRVTPVEWLDEVRRTRRASSFVWPVDGAEFPGSVSLLCHVPAGGQPREIIEVRYAEGATEPARSNQLELLSAVCELAGEYHERRNRTASLGREPFDRFVREIHRRLDLEATCFAIANEGRSLLTCDRVSILVRGGRRFRLIAVSGLDRFDRRSEEVSRLEELAEVVARGRQPIWRDGRELELPEQLERSLSKFVDQSDARVLAVVPLTDADASADLPCDQILVLERFDGTPLADETRRAVAAIAPHCFQALRHAMHYERIPWPARWLGRAVGVMFGSRVWTTTLISATVIGCLAALLLVKTDFEIHCRGELQPTERRDVFAPVDGAVERLLVAGGDQVGRDDPLLVLSNSELEYERNRLLGELRTQRTRLNATRSAMSSGKRGSHESRERMFQLTAEEQQLNASIASLEKQYRLLQRRLDQLNVASPVSGRVLTSSLDQRLRSRPVQRGQRLITVANVDGAWQLELKVADHDIAHVQRAIAGGEKAPRVTYRLATDSTNSHSAKVTDVGLATEVDESRGLFVRVVAAIDQAEIDSRRPGAGVVAKIYCGRRSLAFVWLRDAIEVARVKLFFW